MCSESSSPIEEDALRSVVTPTFSAPLCVHQALDFIYVSFKRLIPYDRIGLALVDPDSGVIRQEWQRAERPELMLPSTYSGTLASSSLGRVLAEKRPRVLNDLVAYLEAHPQSAATTLLVQRGVRSSLTCPLTHEGRPFGLLFFSSCDLGTYSSGHVASFVALASEVATLVAPGDTTVSLGEVIARLAVQLDRVYRERQIIEQIARRVHHGVTLDEVMNEVYDALEPVVPFDRIGLALLDESQGTVVSRWARSRAARFVLRGGYSLPIASTSLGAVASSGKPRIIDDLTEYLTQHPDSASTHLMVREGMRSSLTCPLAQDGKTIGFIFFSSTVPSSYHAEHIATYERIADEVSIAVARSHQYDQRVSDHHFSESLLSELLPRPVLRSLRHRRGRVANHVSDAGILFVDIQGFTSWSMRTEPAAMVGILDRLFRDFDRCCEGRPVHKLRTIGDAYMAVSGVTETSPSHFEALADVALQMIDAASRTLDPLGRPVVVRAGIACGAVVAGVLGGKVPHYDVWGPCVNLAARLQAVAPAQRLCVDGASAERLGGRFMLDPVGPHQLKGVGTLDVFLVARRSLPLPG